MPGATAWRRRQFLARAGRHDMAFGGFHLADRGLERVNLAAGLFGMSPGFVVQAKRLEIGSGDSVSLRRRAT